MKGMADYLCEECRRMERAFERDYRKKEERELQEFIEQTRREIAETEAWLRQEEETEAAALRLEPSAMFYLLKRCGGTRGLACFDFRPELEEMAATMGLTTIQTAAYILVAGLQRRCPEGVGAIHLARYSGREQETRTWSCILQELQALGLLTLTCKTDKGTCYYTLKLQ